MRFATFALATLLLNLTPGPDMMYVIARSLGQGRRAGIVSALGIGAGCLVHTFAAALGIVALLRSWPFAFRILRYAGGAYLVYLGIRLLVSPRPGTLPGEATVPASLGTIFRQGVVTNVLNPKVAIFFLAFLPQFVVPSRGAIAWQMTALGIYFDVSGTLVNLGVACVAGAAGNFLKSSGRMVLAQRSSGSVCVVLGLRVILSRPS